MPDLINWDLIRNPYNWAAIILFVAAPMMLVTVYRCAQRAKQGS